MNRYIMFFWGGSKNVTLCKNSENYDSHGFSVLQPVQNLEDAFWGLKFGYLASLFNNISVMSRSVLWVEENGVPRENYLPVAMSLICFII
jgi:hypothetical protein